MLRVLVSLLLTLNNFNMFLFLFIIIIIIIIIFIIIIIIILIYINHLSYDLESNVKLLEDDTLSDRYSDDIY